MERKTTWLRSLCASFACAALVVSMMPAMAFGGGSVTDDNVTISGVTSDSDGLRVATTLTVIDQWRSSTYTVKNTSSKALDVTVKVKEAKGINGGSSGVVYNPDTMKMSWTFGTESITNPAVGDTLSQIIPAGGSCTLEIMDPDYGKSFLNESYSYPQQAKYYFQAAFIADEPADVSGVNSYWYNANGKTDTLKPSWLNYTDFGTERCYSYTVEVNSSKLNESNTHVYDLASLTELKCNFLDNGFEVRFALSGYFGKTLRLIATDKILTKAQLRALQALMNSSGYYTIVMPTEADFKQYLDEEGYFDGCGSLSVNPTSGSCASVSGSFNVYAGDQSVDSLSYTIYVDGAKLKSGYCGFNGARNLTFTKAGFNPSTRHSVKLEVTTVARGFSNTKTYTATQETAAFSKAYITPVKLSSSKVSIGVTVPTKECGKGLTKVKVYKGSKLIKSFTTTGKDKYIFTHSKAGAAKAKYRVKVYWASKTSLNAPSSNAKVRANSKKFSYSTNPTNYARYSQHFKLKSISQSGGYVVVKGFFVNTHIYSAKIRCKFNLTVGGKVVAKKTLTSKKLGENRVQHVTFKVKPKVMKDLYNNTSGGTWSVYEIS